MSGRANNRLRRRFGVALRKRRKAAGFSQDALGAASNLSGKFIGEVERSEKSVSLDSLALIARALRCTITALVRGAR